MIANASATVQGRSVLGFVSLAEAQPVVRAIRVKRGEQDWVGALFYGRAFYDACVSALIEARRAKDAPKGVTAS